MCPKYSQVTIVHRPSFFIWLMGIFCRRLAMATEGQDFQWRSDVPRSAQASEARLLWMLWADRIIGII